MKENQGLQVGSAKTVILAVLKDGKRHGYDIAKEVEERSDNTMKFNHGTLYPVLHQLQREGYISSTWEQPEGERRRRVYYLTEQGRTHLEYLIKSWTDYSVAMNKILRGEGSEQA